MAVTAIANIINPEVLADQISAKFPDKLVLGNSSLVDLDGAFPMGSPGTTLTIPFWKRIAAFGDIVENTPLVPGNIEADTEKAVVVRGGVAFQVLDTASLVSKADPMTEIADQLARRAAEYVDAKLVTLMELTPNAVDGTAAIINQNSVLGAMITTLGDNYQDMLAGGMIFMHSKVFYDLITTGAIQNQYQSGMDTLRTGWMPTISGLPIVLTDRVATVASSTVLPKTYSTYIVGRKALALFYQRQVLVEFDRDILNFADIISASVHFAPHMYGWDESDSTQAAQDAKSIHVVKLRTR